MDVEIDGPPVGSLRIISSTPGAVVFVDSGEAVTNGPFRLSRLRSDAGAGLRFSVARFESTMIRLDVAYAFNPSPLSRRGIVVSFATTQAF